MNPKRWNVLKAAGLGVVPGVIYSLYTGPSRGEFVGGIASGGGIGYIVGGAIACAACFAIIAAIRNRVVRAR